MDTQVALAHLCRNAFGVNAKADTRLQCVNSDLVNISDKLGIVVVKLAGVVVVVVVVERVVVSVLFAVTVTSATAKEAKMV